MQLKKLKLHIDTLLPNAKWNFDFKDCENILRIDSEENVVLKIIDLLDLHNHSCEELK